jgi:hypothetical protein
MKIIKLTNGGEAFVDDEDFERLSKYTWRRKDDGRTSYAKAYGGGGRKNRITLLMHRKLMEVPRGVVIDHVDGNGLNNQKNNLRVCTCEQNHWNRHRLNSNNTSGYRGVSWDKKTNKWLVRVGYDGKRVYGGLFENRDSAVVVYKKITSELYGEYVGSV